MKRLLILTTLFVLCLCMTAQTPSIIDRPKVGLVLGGGGAKGAAEVGALKVIEELNIPIDYIAGTSIGAILGGLYATGYRAEQLDSLFRSGLWMTDNVLELLDRLTETDEWIDFDELPIPFRCVAVDFDTQEEVVFRNGHLATAMRASMAIPGRTYRCFECPDFFQLTVDNGPKKGQKKWVLVVSVDWDNEQYFVGDFDGTTFHAEGLKQETGVYVDCGPDFYASRTFKDFDGTLGGKVYSMGWMSNWRYCRDLPMTYGKGFWSVPRELSLLDTPAGWRLVQRPKQELTTLRGTRQHYQGRLKQGRTVVKDVARLENVYEAEVSFDTSVSNTFGLNLCAGGGRKLVVTYDTSSHSLVVDRTQVADFEMTKFEHTCHAKVAPINGRLKLRIFVDKCCVEIFSEDGTSVFSLATFAADDHTALELFAHQPGTNYQLDVWPMTSIWPSVAQ